MRTSKKATFGLGYKITLTKNSDNSVSNKANATVIDKIKINSIEWYVPHYTPSIPQQTLLSKQTSSKLPTELQSVERSVFMKEVNTQNLWTFELGTQEGINIPIWISKGFNKELGKIHRNLTMIRFMDP